MSLIGFSHRARNIGWRCAMTMRMRDLRGTAGNSGWSVILTGNVSTLAKLGSHGYVTRSMECDCGAPMLNMPP